MRDYFQVQASGARLKDCYRWLQADELRALAAEALNAAAWLTRSRMEIMRDLVTETEARLAGYKAELAMLEARSAP